jgi:late competence protein required for DNA uptake (superfamily II DNA/RNA helicase)
LLSRCWSRARHTCQRHLIFLPSTTHPEARVLEEEKINCHAAAKPASTLHLCSRSHVCDRPSPICSGQSCATPETKMTSQTSTSYCPDCPFISRSLAEVCLFRVQGLRHPRKDVSKLPGSSTLEPGLVAFRAPFSMDLPET